MNDHVGPRRWGLALFAILGAVAIGTVMYQAGVSRGIALQPPVAVAPPAPGAPPVAQGPYAPYAPYPYYPYRFYRPRPFGFFGPLLILLFVFVLVRRILWGGGGWRRHRWNGDPDAWFQRFDEWHRRSHDRMRDTPSAPPSV